MTAEVATRRGRVAAEGLMVDACTVTRLNGSGTLDPDGLSYSGAPAADSIYEGKCRVRRTGTQGDEQQAGDKTIGVTGFLVSLPMTAVGVQLDDLVTVTASALDPDLVGRRLRVSAVTRGTHVTARRLQCEEVVL